MQIYIDKQMQHTTINGLQRPAGNIGNEIYIVNNIGGVTEYVDITNICPTINSTHSRHPMVIAIKKKMNVPFDNKIITFEPGILKREGGHYYENVCGTLRANAGDNQMVVAYTLKLRGATIHTGSPIVLLEPLGRGKSIDTG